MPFSGAKKPDRGRCSLIRCWIISKPHPPSLPRSFPRRHKDTRTNIPTEELRGVVDTDEKAPPTILYPRDPSLDPQLVWKGKDEQDRADLAVPEVLKVFAV
jgi:adenine-specific DNA-methyltransferase